MIFQTEKKSSLFPQTKQTALLLPIRIEAIGFYLEIVAPTKENAGRLAFVSRQNLKHLRPFQPWVNETRSWKHALDFLKCDWAMHQEGTWSNYSLIKNNHLIGGIRRRNWHDGSCSVSYWLTQENQKQGIMKQALKRLEEEHFKHSNATLLLQIDSQNSPSLNRAQKSGYIQQPLISSPFDCAIMGEITSEENDLVFIKTHDAFLNQSSQKRFSEKTRF